MPTKEMSKEEFLNKRLEILEQINLLIELDFEEGRELLEIKRIKQLLKDSVSQQREILKAFQNNWNKYDDVTKIRNKDIEAHIKGTL